MVYEFQLKPGLAQRGTDYEQITAKHSLDVFDPDQLAFRAGAGKRLAPYTAAGTGHGDDLLTASGQDER